MNIQLMKERLRLNLYMIDIKRHDRVKATTGYFKGRTNGYVTRVSYGQACIVWKGYWSHGIWVDLNDLKRTKRYKTND